MKQTTFMITILFVVLCGLVAIGLSIYFAPLYAPSELEKITSGHDNVYVGEK